MVPEGPFQLRIFCGSVIVFGACVALLSIFRPGSGLTQEILEKSHQHQESSKDVTCIFPGEWLAARKPRRSKEKRCLSC